MDANEKQELLESLEGGRDALLAALHDVTEDQAARAPAPGRWSVLECVEHVVLAEENMFSRVVSAESSETPVGSRARENSIRKRGADRSTLREAPEAAWPRGRFPTLGDAREAFAASNDEVIRYVRALIEDPRLRGATHPLIGPVNCYEMLWIIAVHPQRHASQIREIRDGLFQAS